ncbi:hypothetical protein BGZ94_009997, partial [Podila epigama]
SLNINALTISSTSTKPSTIALESVIVREQLSVVSASGDIRAAVGMTISTLPFPREQSYTPDAEEVSALVSLNTLDGEVQFDFKAWNQSCTFKVDSPLIQVVKGGVVVLPFANHTDGVGNGGHLRWNETRLDQDGLSLNTTGYHSITGLFKPLSATTTVTKRPTTTTSLTTASATPSSAGVSMGSRGAGGSLLPARVIVQANKRVYINFP